jgi:hypothetical protein
MNHHVRHTLVRENAIIAFFDSNAGGIGGSRGLIEKLDYLADVLPYFGDGREGAD